MRIQRLLLLAVGLPLSGMLSAQTYTKTETISYHDNTTKWVLGQVASVTDVGTGLIQSSTTFDSVTAVPLTTSNFGKLQTTLTYNANGTVATVKDGRNNITTLSSWKRGIPQSISYAGGASESAVVNDSGWITSHTDENGYVTGYGYDPMGRLASIVYPTGDTVVWNTTTRVFVRVTIAEYGISAGHWRLTESTGNARKITYFDAQWRPVLVREYDNANVAATDRYTATAYDKLGRVWRSAYPVATAPTMSAAADWPLSGTRTSYDALGRPTSVVQDAEAPYGTLTTSISYLTGFKTQVTNPRAKVTTTSFLAWDAPISDYPVLIAHPGSVYTHISRDAFGKATSIRRSDSSSPTGGTKYLDRTYTYNANQELCRVVEPETGATLMGFDAAGNLWWSASGLISTTACDANGNTTAILARKAARTYDVRNRIATLTFPDGNGNQTWSYTPDGLPASVTTYNDGGASSVINTYAYNKRRLPTSETLQQTANPDTWAIGYGYDPNGVPASLVYPTGLSLTITANALGQPTQIASATQTYASGISYFPNGALKQFTYGNGIVHSLSQNARSLPAISKDLDGATAVHQDEYTYDQVGNVLAITDAATGQSQRGNRSMAYDDLDRLSSTTSPMFGTASYSYDVLDNLTHVQVTGGSQIRNQDYCYDTANRLTNVKTGGCGGTSVIGLGYDVQGNLANKNGVLFGFDYGNRMRTGGPETYRYDAYGRRVRSSNSTGQLLYSLYGQSGQLLWQRDERTNQRRNYVYLQDSLLAEHRRPIGSTTETIIYQHTDALGSPVATTSSTKTVLQRSEYEPYGYLLNRAMEDGPGYTGHATDAGTGLVYMQQRYYDPLIGQRFLSADPVSADSAGGNFNRYWYASQNPYGFKDPDGREAQRPNQKPPQSCEGPCPEPVTQDDHTIPAPPDPNARPNSPQPRSFRQAVEDKLCYGACEWRELLRLLDLVPGGEGAGLKIAGLGVFKIFNEIRYANGGMTILKTGHYAGRLTDAGLDVARTEAIVAREAARVAPNMAVGVDVYGRMRVNGVLIEYGLRKLPSGRINVGTIYPVR